MSGRRVRRAESSASKGGSRARSDCGPTRRENMLPSTRLRSVVRHIREEFRETPGLRLTPWQIQRLWHLDADDRRAAVRRLVEEQFLREDRNGSFVRAS